MKQRNFVAKYAVKVNKAATFKSRKQASKRVRGIKHKGKPA